MDGRNGWGDGQVDGQTNGWLAQGRLLEQRRDQGLPGKLNFACFFDFSSLNQLKHALKSLIRLVRIDS